MLAAGFRDFSRLHEATTSALASPPVSPQWEKLFGKSVHLLPGGEQGAFLACVEEGGRAKPPFLTNLTSPS